MVFQKLIVCKSYDSFVWQRNLLEGWKKKILLCSYSLAPNSNSYGLNLFRIYVGFMEMQDSESIVLNCYGWLPHFLWVDLWFFVMTWEPRVTCENETHVTAYWRTIVESGHVLCSCVILSRSVEDLATGKKKEKKKNLPSLSHFNKTIKGSSPSASDFQCLHFLSAPSPTFPPLNQQNLYI